MHGRGTARFRVVRLGGPRVRKVRGNAGDPLGEGEGEGGDVHMYRHSSVASLLDLRRRPKVFVDVLGDLIRSGFTVARSLELSAQWNCILWSGLLHPLSAHDLLRVKGGGPGWFHEVARWLHCRLSEVHSGDCGPAQGWLFSFSAIPVLLLGALVSWLILQGSMRNSVKLGFPTFAHLTDGKPAWRNLTRRWRVRCRCFRMFDFLFTGADLAVVVLRKTATAGSFDGWCWRETKALPEPWFDELARMWAAARMVQLEDWFKSWVPDSVFSAGGCRSSVEAWYTTAVDIEMALAGAFSSHVHVFVAVVVNFLDTVDREILDRVLSSLGLLAWFRHAFFEFHAHVRLRFKLAAGLGEPWTRDGGTPQGPPLQCDVSCSTVSSLVQVS